MCPYSMKEIKSLSQYIIYNKNINIVISENK